LETTVLHAPNTFDSHSPLPASLGARVDERPIWNSILITYLEGWAEADPTKITRATVEDYDFHDPLVGHFSKQSLWKYFMLLRARFAVSGTVRRRDLAFALRGPTKAALSGAAYEYWREAPHLGLTGTTSLLVTREGVAAEVVAYDLNIASDTLQRSPARARARLSRQTA
jgi:hypothetical protein